MHKTLKTLIDEKREEERAKALDNSRQLSIIKIIDEHRQPNLFNNSEINKSWTRKHQK